MPQPEPYVQTREEAYLWQIAREWRYPQPPDQPHQLDWSRIVSVAMHNRMSMLLDGVLRATGMMACLPPASSQALAMSVSRLAGKADTYSEILRRYMPLAVAQGLVTIPLKGLWVSERIYGERRMRPGHDMDILVPRERVDDCITIVESLGFGRYWPGQLDDAFYRRHHLHLELGLSDCWTWIEIHWALDHPRTRLTIDYDALLARATRSELLGVPVWDPSPPDLLLYLSVHLVKHMFALPAILERPDLERVILADGRLMHFLDIAEAVKRYEEGEGFDWPRLVKLGHEAGAAEILGAVLRVCHRNLAAPVPADVLDALPVKPPVRPIRKLMDQMASVAVADYRGEKVSALWRFLVAEDFTFVFRPIRLLDLLTYLFPGRDFLQRRYGRSGTATGAAHLLRSLLDYGRLALDTVRYSWQRRRRELPIFVTSAYAEAAEG